MTALPTDNEFEPELDPEEDLRVPIARFRRLKKAHEYGLVILSGKQPYWVEKIPGGWMLLVPPDAAGNLQTQLKKYGTESVNWPPPEPVLPEQPSQWWPVATWSTVLLGAHLASQRWPELYPWGQASAEQIMNGQWWRAWSALLLHADSGHLIANLLFGSLFLYFTGRLLGGRSVLLATILAGGFGNLLNAWTYYPEAHLSIGASTAVFATVGLLAAFPLGFGLRNFWKRRMTSWSIPLVTGIIFLAWFGTGEERVDVSAHLFGFLAGLPFGTILGFKQSFSKIGQEKTTSPKGTRGL